MNSTSVFLVLMLTGTALATLKASPAVSPSVLEEYFINISKTAGVFPDANTPGGRLFIVDGAFKECITVWGAPDGNGLIVLNVPCKFNQAATAATSLIWLKHAGDGFINLALTYTKCIGTGYNVGSGVYTGDWCDSGSHQFALIPSGSIFSLVQKETGKCLSTVKNTPAGSINPLIITNCDISVTNQQWRACDISGANCWPSPK